mmetsp:Transcript_7706/g.21925  ORF Transcript_7706/g.21925 Transcript_7706/m.21925 type:complete len:292 (+) Transcript_7706:136-1011(+)|eukprot:CAMPEP_0117662264 /NCGR_PEP_ID=MMETSP0804-20121206/7963_1 /TAXON_ID=1074897 /ORGANISM="Tetraselmis astigmatica, Strain CCMP880" /LENGTH=291 /DNA_ID=CAMNT_0005469157 /DNA_START=86 /DNA_END=961 /DNA_ORIENTATION=-
MADFVNKQFDKEEVHQKVLEQYDQDHTRIFYRYVMGGGGHDIHFGVFKEPSWGVKESSEATTNIMLDLLNWSDTITPEKHVLDLGSGHGGGTHALVQRFGCKVTGINIGPEQNKVNMDRCKELGVADKVSTVVGNINEPLPFEDNTFDACFSCEVLCHAGDKEFTLKEVKRVLKPGAAIVFSDLMGADDADEAALKSFTDRNATTVMGRPSWYLANIKAAGLKYVCWWDNSNHLEKYFREMLRQIADYREDMKNEGITDEYLDNWVTSLTDRAEIQASKGVFSHGFFVARK